MFAALTMYLLKHISECVYVFSLKEETIYAAKIPFK